MTVINVCQWQFGALNTAEVMHVARTCFAPNRMQGHELTCWSPHLRGAYVLVAFNLHKSAQRFCEVPAVILRTHQPNPVVSSESRRHLCIRQSSKVSAQRPRPAGCSVLAAGREAGQLSGSRMSGHSMAAQTACLQGLRRVRLGAWPLRQGLAGRCLEDLATLSRERGPPPRQLRSLQTAVRAAWCQHPRCDVRPGPSAVSLGSLLPSAVPFSPHRGLGPQRQLHASTVCHGKKKSAEGFVKRISKGEWDFWHLSVQLHHLAGSGYPIIWCVYLFCR